MKENQKIIQAFDAKPAVRRGAENAYDWEYHNDAIILYDLAARFRDELLDPLEHIGRDRMPAPVISFDDARNNKVLAYYTLGRNAQGLLDEITFNTAHYEEKNGVMQWKYGQWSQFETLLHEQTHLLLKHLSEMDGRKRPAHGKEFVEKCELLGLHVRPIIGSHFAVAEADSPFGRIMKEMGIPRPDDVPRDDPKADWFRPRPEKGKSTLSKWCCPNCGLALRVGIKGDINSTHDDCGVKFVKADGKEHNLYTA